MTRDRECVRFLRWALPRLGYRWAGYRKVRRQVCCRIHRRCRQLALESLGAYRELLEGEPGEWARLDDCCRVTISRFYRDRGLWEAIEHDVLPTLLRVAQARGSPPRIWSAGCGAGEEPYTAALVAHLGSTAPPGSDTLEIVATDLDPHQLERARRGVYPASCLRDLPAEWRRAAFEPTGDGGLRLIDAYREGVRFAEQDLRREAPDGAFDLILCRNLAFTYFDAEGQAGVLERLLVHLRPGGWLAVGSHEELLTSSSLEKPSPGLPLYRRSAAPVARDSVLGTRS